SEADEPARELPSIDPGGSGDDDNLPGELAVDDFRLLLHDGLAGKRKRFGASATATSPPASARVRHRTLTAPTSCGAQLLLDRLAYRRPRPDAAEVIRDLRRLVDVDAVAVEPLRQGEQVGIAHRIGVAGHPWPLEHLALDQREALADRLRHLALHRE